MARNLRVRASIPRRMIRPVTLEHGGIASLDSVRQRTERDQAPNAPRLARGQLCKPNRCEFRQATDGTMVGSLGQEMRIRHEGDTIDR